MHRSGTSDFFDVVRTHAATTRRAGLSFLRNAKSGVVDESMSYEQLHESASAIAAWLTTNGMRGQRALLLFPDGLDFVTAFVGCLYARTVAVPAPLPGVSTPASIRTASILRDVDPAIVLTDSSNLESVRRWLAGEGVVGMPCEDVRGLVDKPHRWIPPAFDSDSLAFIQYTSGSTSEAKGVMISHGNLLANLESIRRSIGSTPELRGVGWLPAIHDMGLIGQLLSVIFAGGQLVFMPPKEFIRSPFRWLALVDEMRATHTAAPNFAYELCLRRVTDEQVAALNLSSLEVVLNGAEPVGADTLSAFVKRFAPAGFRESAFAPCYGLAEATLLVSASPRLERPVTAVVDADAFASRRFVEKPAGGSEGCTTPDSGSTISTSHPDVRPNIGEIWVRGHSVARGYWRRDAETAETFGGTVADGRSGYLRTGDLGALRDGELFVTGRLKDVLLVNGRNIYPHDVAQVVRTVDEHLKDGASAIFTVTESTEDVVVVQESRPALLRAGRCEEVVREVRRVLMRHFSLSAYAVVLARPGAVRRTTSGKIQHSLMRKLFNANEIDMLCKEVDGHLMFPGGIG
jgi:acyl-CoA synthetase (AMP-forming)/AMP-acid ligase II